jgi:hypothetical protein
MKDSGGQKAGQIIAAFNTWSFKREKPSDLDLLVRCVTRAVDRQAAIPFVLYWGKGPRSYACSAEQECLHYLGALAKRIETVYEPGALMELVFTDTHARLNGHSEMALESYFSNVQSAADSRLFRGHRLSDVVARTELDSFCTSLPDAETLNRLEKCAAKWFSGEGSAADGARRYFAMNMVEKQAMEAQFPNSIFVTFNGSEYRCLFPERLPIFYMYSLRKGFAVKPWFLPDPARPAESALNGAAA